ISTDTGGWPRWSPDGKKLYYVEPSTNRLVAADIYSGPTFRVGKPTVIPVPREQATLSVVANEGRNYDITPDGKQFVIVMSAVTHIATNRASQCRPELVRRIEAAGTCPVRSSSPMKRRSMGCAESST